MFLTARSRSAVPDITHITTNRGRAKLSTLFAHVNVSLDGYICDAHGEIDWHFADAEFQRYLDQLLESIDGMVFGRVAYEQLASYWPTAGEEVSIVQRNKMHDLPKYVMSHEDVTKDWHRTEWLGADPYAALRDVKQGPGRGIAVFAGGSAISSLIGADLVDQLRLVLNPVLLGGGKRLFDDTYPTATWSLLTARPFSSGAVLLTYQRRLR
jgi:dihydrofolate reductase